MTKQAPIAMRDAFLSRLYELAREDRNIILVSADMGAPTIDKFRRDLSGQYVNVGVAEQNMIMVAAGLALGGKKVFTFTIGPFATARCFEFTKVDISLMNLPVTILGVGAGFSYDSDGPTHYTTEDVSIMRALPHLQILSPCDSIAAAKCADLTYAATGPTYLRLDRQEVPEVYGPDESFAEGFHELRPGDDLCIVATANMVHTALAVQQRLARNGQTIAVIDLYRLKPTGENFQRALAQYQTIVSLEEHLLDGGLGSIISEIITDHRLPVALKRIGLRQYVYAYGRKNIQKRCGIDEDAIVQAIEPLCGTGAPTGERRGSGPRSRR